jgi:cell division protein FtsB
MEKAVRAVKKEKKKKSLLWRVAILVVFANILVVFVSQRITIAKKQAQYDALSGELTQQQVANEELKSLTEAENIATYVERIAREMLNYVFPGEKIFVNIVGN